MLSPDEAAQRFTTRFRLTREDGRAAVWFSLQEGLGWLIGVALLTLVCVFWPALGTAGGVAAIVVPFATVVKVLSLFNRAAKLVERFRDRELVVSLDRAGLGFDSGQTQTKIQWAAIRRIVRGPAVWVFTMRGDRPFFIPAAAIPVEARALVARWAGDAGARQT